MSFKTFLVSNVCIVYRFRLCVGEAVSQLYRACKHEYVLANGPKNKYLLDSARTCRRRTNSAPSEHSNQSPPSDVCTWGNVREHSENTCKVLRYNMPLHVYIETLLIQTHPILSIDRLKDLLFSFRHSNTLIELEEWVTNLLSLTLLTRAWPALHDDGWVTKLFINNNIIIKPFQFIIFKKDLCLYSSLYQQSSCCSALRTFSLHALA